MPFRVDKRRGSGSLPFKFRVSSQEFFDMSSLFVPSSLGHLGTRPRSGPGDSSKLGLASLLENFFGTRIFGQTGRAWEIPSVERRLLAVPV